MFCVKCGAENEGVSKFCRKCGAPLRKSQKVEKPASIEQSVKFEPTAVVKSTYSQAMAAGQEKPLAKAEEEIVKTTEAVVKSITALNPNIAGLLCYILGWVSGIILLLIKKEDKFVCFHAWQSIITFVSLDVILIILSALPMLAGLIFVTFRAIYFIIIILTLLLWLFLMYKAYKGQIYKLPVIGNLAQNLSQK